MGRKFSDSFARLREKVPSVARRMRDLRNGIAPHPTRLCRATFSREREKGSRTIFRNKVLALVVLFACTLIPHIAFAVEPGEMLKDPKLEARARALSQQLRCLVCQNESIDDSQARLAHDFRVLIRQRIKAGESNAQIKAFLVSRYGDFILLKPPFKPETLLLWGTPVLLLVLGSGAIVLAVRRRKPMRKPASLNATEEARLAELVGNEER